MARSRSFLRSTAASILAIVCGCGESGPPAPAELPAPAAEAPLPDGAEAIESCVALQIDELPENANVVLIVNDTMRRDRMGVHGGPAPTPRFDDFARSNHYFSAAASVAPWTKPSIASLFTSLPPAVHGLLDDPRRRHGAQAAWSQADGLSEDFHTMAELLRRWGYRTAAIVTNPWLETKFGFAQGFEEYRDRSADWSFEGDHITREAIDWLEAHRDERVFLYVHYMGGHRPYGPLSAEDIALAQDRDASDDRSFSGIEGTVLDLLRLPEGVSIASLEPEPGPALVELAYDRGLEEFDRALGELLDYLEAAPASDRTAILVTSDHGEALFERGWGNHGRSFFEEEVGIPLAFRLPGLSQSAAEITCPVSLLDVLPTLCGYLDIRCPPGVTGESWLASGEERAPRHLRYEANMEHTENRAIRNARYKLIYEPYGPTRLDASRSEQRREEGAYLLFDLEKDPGERHDLLATPTASAQAIADALARELHAEASNPDSPAAPSAEIDSELRDRLEALGYVR